MEGKLLLSPLILIVFIDPPFVWSGNILAVFPLPAPSHFRSFQPLFEEAVRRGHKLTLISGHCLTDDLQTNYTHINIKSEFQNLRIIFSEIRHHNRLENLIYYVKSVHEYNEFVLQSPEVQRLLKSNNTFDAVLVELFLVDVFVSFGYRFSAPVIGLSPLPLLSYYSWTLGNPQFPAYIPNIFLPFTEKMSFIERFINVGYMLVIGLYYEIIALPKYQQQMEKYVPFGDKHTPNLRELMSNISVTLVNSHYSFHYMRPSMPNIIETAGLHIVPREPLPEALQTYMDNATNGVIFISLGSLIEPQYIKSLGQVIIHSLASLPQKILFKWDSKLLSNVPQNFFIQKWIPQISILNHPNCRLFITHGGLHSLLESINASVPVIGIPFFTDQYHNLAIVEHHKIGKLLPQELIERNILRVVQETLNDDSYYANVKERSWLFNERQSSPLDTAMFWVEHILAHKDTSHLKSESLSMPWYKYLLLDMAAALTLIISLFFYVMYKCLKVCQRRIKCHLKYDETVLKDTRSLINKSKNKKYD